jgi:hypothetical protein
MMGLLVLISGVGVILTPTPVCVLEARVLAGVAFAVVGDLPEGLERTGNVAGGQVMRC